jgi:hypothetical protein
MAVWLRRCASFVEEADADRDYWSHFAPDERVALIADLRREWSTMNGIDEKPSGDFTDFLNARHRRLVHRARCADPQQSRRGETSGSRGHRHVALASQNDCNG